MRLLGKNSACSNDRVSSQMSSSHIFFPRSSFIGREQKSSCQSYGKSTISPEGAPVCDAGSGMAREATTEASRRAPGKEARLGAIAAREARPAPRAAPTATPMRATEAAVADIVRACGSRYRRRDEVEDARDARRGR